jgi:hypothetical protein
VAAMPETEGRLLYGVTYAFRLASRRVDIESVQPLRNIDHGKPHLVRPGSGVNRARGAMTASRNVLACAVGSKSDRAVHVAWGSRLY